MQKQLKIFITGKLHKKKPPIKYLYSSLCFVLGRSLRFKAWTQKRGRTRVSLYFYARLYTATRILIFLCAPQYKRNSPFPKTHKTVLRIPICAPPPCLIRVLISSHIFHHLSLFLSILFSFLVSFHYFFFSFHSFVFLLQRCFRKKKKKYRNIFRILHKISLKKIIAIKNIIKMGSIKNIKRVNGSIMIIFFAWLVNLGLATHSGTFNQLSYRCYFSVCKKLPRTARSLPAKKNVRALIGSIK